AQSLSALAATIMPALQSALYSRGHPRDAPSFPTRRSSDLLELALACDLRVATSDCELGLPEVKVGLVPDVGGTTRLVRTVGYARSEEHTSELQSRGHLVSRLPPEKKNTCARRRSAWGPSLR